MKVFKKRPVTDRMTRLDALSYKPVKSQQITETRLETGEVVIEYPMTVRPLIASVARRLGKSRELVQKKKLQLDALGTSVWDLIDGERSVGSMIQTFAETHRLENREAEVSVTQFIRELGKRGLLGLR